jgi:hypothetical protein
MHYSRFSSISGITEQSSNASTSAGSAKLAAKFTPPDEIVNTFQAQYYISRAAKYKGLLIKTCICIDEKYAKSICPAWTCNLRGITSPK